VLPESKTPSLDGCSGDNNYLGYPIIKSGDMTLCLKCNARQLFVRERNINIECASQLNCDLSKDNK